jgi:hypothetical protein
MERIENRTFDEIKPGDTASLVRTLTQRAVCACRGISIRRNLRVEQFLICSDALLMMSR